MFDHIMTIDSVYRILSNLNVFMKVRKWMERQTKRNQNIFFKICYKVLEIYIFLSSLKVQRLLSH